ncbi:MAG: efflux RND transporter periplasmic adaptor subunit [Candidatus Aminicenantes bacterium]|nr:efflux RND transporter periplasmic adaptor subunit [Candidatus Aminicenantes bacterium]
MLKKVTVIISAAILVGLLFFLLSYRWNTPPQTNPQQPVADEHSEEAQPDDSIIELQPEALDNLNLGTDTASYRALSLSIKATGKIVMNEDRHADVSPRTSGRVAEVLVTLGDKVIRGQKLLVLDSLELGELKARYLQAAAKVHLTEANYQREKKLFEANIAPQKDMIEAETAYQEAIISFKACEDLLKLHGLSPQEIERLREEPDAVKSTFPIMSPIDGEIIERHKAFLGEMVDPQTDLFTIADLSTVWVMVDIYEKDLAHIKKGLPTMVTVAAYPRETFHGVITYISSLLDASTRTVKARVEIDNQERKLKPEMFAAISILTEEQERVLTIPKESVQTDGEHSFVFVVIGKGRFEKREITLGRETETLAEVTEGLKENEVVVTKGSFLLKAETEKGRFAEEH